jgi:SAM-dependent methyltransferase
VAVTLLRVVGPDTASDADRRHFLQPSWRNRDAHRRRFEQVRGYLEGRSVLDLGCASGHLRPDWFHRMIGEVASDVVGVDVDAAAVAAVGAQGFDVVVGDAHDLDLGRTFDVVHAGELIEHLDDPRAFLASVRRHLRPDSRFVLTTPNVFCVTNTLYRFGGRAAIHRDHVCWYCEDTLRHLLERHGFEVVEMRYLRHETPGRLRSVVSRLLRAALPDRLAWNSLLAVARLAP